jgi:hypothetical protein
MHDIDRTQLESSFDALESGEAEITEELEFAPEEELEGPFDEAEEMELAADLLEITDEAELDQFIGKLIKRAGRAAGQFVKSSTGRALGGILKDAAKKALPVIGGALGGYVAPKIGTSAKRGRKFGTQVASGAGALFGLELEGLSPEDLEFELARGFVRFAGAAAKQAAQAPAGLSPPAAAKTAAVAAARRFAPGMLGSAGAAIGAGQSGRWIRRGRVIVLFGV